jgi:hypothetical protein
VITTEALEASRKAAITYIQSSFPPVPTNIAFDSPAVIIDQISPLPIPSTILQAARLTVPATTELRMRYWHLLDPRVSTADLLVRCLTKGLPYHISLPGTSSSSNSIPQPLIIQHRHEKVSVPMINNYQANVQRVLHRPNAYKLLEHGGLIWRIVRQYRPEVLTNAFTGLASANDTDPTADDINMLIGMTTNQNSFWPLPAWYEKSGRYNGEWTSANEAWFTKHVEEIKHARTSCLRSGRSWQNGIRIHTPVKMSDPTVSGTMAHAEACCSHLVRNWPELWDGFVVERLSNTGCLRQL